MTLPAPHTNSVPAAVPAGARFYGINATKVTLGEYLYEATSPVLGILIFIIAVVIKLFRIRPRISGSTDDVPVESLEPFILAAEDFPVDVWQKLEPHVASLETLGFQVVEYHAVHDPVSLTDTYLITMLGPRNILGRVHLRTSHRHHPPKHKIFLELLTRLQDDSYVWSTSGKPDMKAPPSCLVVRKVGAPAAALLQLHEKKVASQPHVAQPLRTPQQTVALANWHHTVVRDFHLNRGVFCDLRDFEQERLVAAANAPQTIADASVTAGAAAPPVPSRYQNILDEIDRIQNAKTGWRSTIILLVISLIFFSAGGAAGWARGDFLYLIPILFFHELGHYITMRVFGYRNLRMFFIPFFGAAVTGRNYNIPGWKKSVVALMGPLPGIVVGLILGIIAASTGNTTLYHISLLALILNGINLLPILPLDGGHVFQNVLSCRHYGLDMAFRIIAVVVFAGGVFLLNDHIAIPLAVSLAVGIPLAYRLGRAAYELRQEGVSVQSTDARTVPPEIAEKIIDKLSAGSSKPVFNKIMAQRVLNVFENLNARPPGWFGSIALLFTQGSAVFAAVVGLVLIVATQNGGLQNLLHRGQRQPQHLAPAGPLQEQPGPAYRFAGAAMEQTVVATFPNENAADRYNTLLAIKLPPGAILRQYGDTLFFTCSAGDKFDADSFFSQLEGATKNVFMQNATQATAINMTAVAMAEPQAAAVRAELQEYFAANSVASPVIPPWESTRWADAAAYARIRLARATLVCMRRESTEVFSDPAYHDLINQLTEASRRGDHDETVRLQKQIHESRGRLVQARMQALLDMPADEVDQAFIATVLATPAAMTQPALYKDFPPAAAAMLGPIPDTALSSRQAAESVLRGAVTGKDPTLTLYVTFPSAEHGLPALCHWLQTKGVRQIRYDLHASPLSDEMDEDLE